MKARTNATIIIAAKNIQLLDGKIECDVECNPLHGPRAEELIKKLEAGEDVDKLNYVDEEIFAHDDTVKSVKATNSLDEF